MADACPTWFDAAIHDDNAGNEVQALCHIFHAVDGILSKAEFAEINEWMASLDAEQLSVNLIVGILSITRPACEHLPARPKFFEDAWTAIEGRGRNSAKLLGALKGHLVAR